MNFRVYHFGPVFFEPRKVQRQFGDIRPDVFARIPQSWPWPFYSDGSVSVEYSEAIHLYAGSQSDDLVPPVLEFKPIVVDIKDLGAPVSLETLRCWFTARYY